MVVSKIQAKREILKMRQKSACRTKMNRKAEEERVELDFRMTGCKRNWKMRIEMVQVCEEDNSLFFPETRRYSTMCITL